MTAQIVLRHVTKRFTTKKLGTITAVNDFNLTVNEGECFSFLGPSGCGKSTTLRMIAGFEDLSEGEIELCGRLVSVKEKNIYVPPEERGLGMVFQAFAVWPHMNIFENVAFPLEIRKLPKSEIVQRVKEALHHTSLDGMEEVYPSDLSGGQQQRIALARAIVTNPKVMLLDEPLSNLDAKLRVDVRTELRQIQQKLGITTIYVTHDQDEALSMSDIIAVMRSGHIEQIGSPWEIYFRPANRFVADFVGTVNFLTARIVSAEGGTVAADHNGMLLQIPTEVPVEPGETVTLVVRPECIRLAEPGESVPEGKSLEGQIENYSFLGRMIRYWVRVGEEQFIIDDANVDLTGARSGAVRLCLNTGKLHILKDGGSHDT